MENQAAQNEITFTYPLFNQWIVSIIVGLFVLMIIFGTIQTADMTSSLGIGALLCEILVLFVCVLPFIRAKKVTVGPKDLTIRHRFLRGKDVVVSL